VSNLAIVPGGGVVYAGESSTIYTLAPAAPVTATTLPLTTDGTVSIPVRCDAPPTRGCRGTLGLEGLEAGIDVGRVPFSVPSGHSKQVLVRVPASVRRAIVRRRRVEFLAETRIGVREHRRLLSSRLLRIDATRPVRRPTCRRGGVRTLRRTPRARIYTVRTPIFREVYETTYGCLFSAGRPVPLDEPVLVEAAPPFRIVGPLVAYKYEFAAEGPNDATTYVRVVDLRTGRERRALCALGPDECSLEGSSAEVRTIVVLPSGGVAWTASTGPDSLVVKADAGREPRVLDEAEGRIHLASLRLHGHRLTWKNRDRTRSATLR
jgi:hypothetical protein